MSGFLIVLAVVGAIVFVFARLFRSRVQRRIETLDLPVELAEARRTAARASVAGRSALAGATAPPAVRAQGAPHFMLIYEVGPDFTQRRAEFRDQHLALAWKASEAGELVLAGALEEPTEQAFLLFRGTREAALRFAAADPYVKHGLVKGFRVKQWHTVVGAQAAAPVRPKS